MKECSKCKRFLGAEMFPPHKRTKSGLSSWCRFCVSEYNKSDRNKVKSRERLKKHRRKIGLKPLPRRTIEMAAIKSGESNLLTCSLCKSQKTSSYFSPSKKPPNSFSSRCKQCQSEAQLKKRNERRKHAPFARFDKWSINEKRTARMRVNAAIASGKLNKMNCVMCDSSESQAHHENYDKPLDVIWLCSAHHADVHKFGVHIIGI